MTYSTVEAHDNWEKEERQLRSMVLLLCETYHDQGPGHHA